MSGKRIAIVVLGCASPPYGAMLAAIRATWGAAWTPGVDVSYVFGRPDDEHARRTLAHFCGGDVPEIAEGQLLRRGDVLLAGCADLIRTQEDCLLHKRLLAFEHLLADPELDLIYTVCATSYVDQAQLVEVASQLRATQLFYGPLGYSARYGTPFISGSSMLLSRDLAQRLVDDATQIVERNRFGWRDDVAFGDWVATRYARLPAELIQQRATTFRRDQLFVGADHQSVDYVMAPQHEHRLRPGAYHYHLHSRHPDAMRNLHHLWLERRADD